MQPSDEVFSLISFFQHLKLRKSQHGPPEDRRLALLERVIPVPDRETSWSWLRCRR
jgi:hypothetical protein